MPALAQIDPLWDQRLARALVRPLRHGPITPNAITTITLIVGLIGAGLCALGGGAAYLGTLLFMLACLLDHADGELARLTGRTSAGGHYYDLAAGGTVLVALFIGIGVGQQVGPLGTWSIVLGGGAGAATAWIFVLRMDLERRAGKAAARQPSLLGFEIEDVMYLVGPITWLGWLQPFLVVAGVGAPLFALFVLWQSRSLRVEGEP